MALVNGGFLHYTDMKKFLKNLVLRIFGPLSSIWVFIADTGSFWSLRSDKQMDMKLFTEFLCF